MNNLARNLIHYPTDCGEQNLIRLIPSVLLVEYLESSTGSGGPGILTNNAISSMESGYQQQLTYRHSDGSFSAFGDTVDEGGSVWITALVTSTFRKAAAYIDIDDDVLTSALYWLAKKQLDDGSFPETGDIINKKLQENDLAMTSFVLIQFLDNKYNLDGNLRDVMNRAISYIGENWLNHNDDLYVLSIVTYALKKSLHPQSDQAFQLLKSFAIRSNDDDNYVYWISQTQDFEKQNPWTQRPNSENIQMTSYGLLSLLAGVEDEPSLFEESIPIVNWLLSQQNSNGGFASTSDTYVAILALKEFSKKLRIPQRGSEIKVEYSYLNTAGGQMKIDSDASTTIMQRRILPPNTRNIKVRATGAGIGLLQIGYEYNLNVTGAWPSFVVNPQVFKQSTANHMKVTVCANYIQDGSAVESNMAIMEVNLPSGFTADLDTLPALRRYRGVSRVDSENSDTKIILYFQSISRSEVCPTISAFRTHRVANQKQAVINVYDYYDQSRVARSFYDIVPATICDICVGQDCPDDGCTRIKSPTFGSYAYGANIDSFGSGAQSLLSRHQFNNYLILIPFVMIIKCMYYFI